MFGRRSCRPMSRHSIPSIFILPFGSASLKNEAIRDDLPAPVRPTIPIYLHQKECLDVLFLYNNLAIHTFSPGFIVQLILLSTKGPSEECR